MPTSTPSPSVGDHRRGRLGDEAGQAAAVGVAEGDVLGAGVGRGAHALERVAGVVAVAVEEVLGVEDDALALLAAEGDRVGDHRQVLLRGRPGSPSRGAGPRSCRPGRRPGRSTRRASAAPRRRRRSMSRRRVIPKAAIVAFSSSSSASRSNSSASFGLELGKPASMNWTPSSSSACDDLQLLLDGERHAVARPCRRARSCRRASPVPSDAFRFERSGRGPAEPACAAAPRQPLGGCGNSPDCLETVQHSGTDLTRLVSFAGDLDGSSHSRYSSARPCRASSNLAWITLRDLARLAERVVVDLAHRHQLGGGAGEEHLVGEVELGAGDVALLDLVAEVAGDLDHRGAGDPVEDRRGVRPGSAELPVADDEDVLAGALARRSRARRAGSPRRSRRWPTRSWRGSSSGTGRRPWRAGSGCRRRSRRQEETLARIPCFLPSSPR